MLPGSMALPSYGGPGGPLPPMSYPLGPMPTAPLAGAPPSMMASNQYPPLASGPCQAAYLSNAFQTTAPMGPSMQQLQTQVPPGVKQQLAERLNTAVKKRHQLVGVLDEITHGEYSDHMQNTFAYARKAGLDDVDWRVPRLMYCKDPKYNHGVPSAVAQDVMRRKMADAQVLEQQLASEAYTNWETALAQVDKAPPPLEVVRQRQVSFMEATPNYSTEDDVWARTLELRTLEEAMRGDVSKPLPRPAVHLEEMQNFREGKYLKDDCPIA